MIKLYIDDERTPKTKGNWVIVRSYNEAVKYVEENGIPEYCSFDHDLGEEHTGYDFAKWLVEQDLDGKHLIPENFTFNAHSANGPGAANINGLLNSYLTAKVNDK